MRRGEAIGEGEDEDEDEDESEVESSGGEEISCQDSSMPLSLRVAVEPEPAGWVLLAGDMLLGLRARGGGRGGGGEEMGWDIE